MVLGMQLAQPFGLVHGVLGLTAPTTTQARGQHQRHLDGHQDADAARQRRVAPEALAKLVEIDVEHHHHEEEEHHHRADVDENEHDGDNDPDEDHED